MEKLWGGGEGRKAVLYCCSELVGCTQLYLQTVKFGLHFELDYNSL